MTTIDEKETNKMEGPREITTDNVMHWSRHAKSLTGSIKSKAQRFLELDLVRYMGNNKFICLPLNTEEFHEFELDGESYNMFKKPHVLDYNTSEYVMQNKSGRFECSCQGWAAKERRGESHAEGCNCSHTLALFLAFKTKRFKRSEVET